MNSVEIYNNFYEKNPNHRYEKSLFEFINGTVKPRIDLTNINILDLGCGNYSMFEDLETGNSQVFAIDFSQKAISLAPNSKINYICASVLNPIEIDQKFNLVFDSHCFNSIKNESQVFALKNIYEKLFYGGLFCSEMMVQPPDHRIVSSLKTIKSTLEVESELIQLGFKIIYFYIVPNFEFSLLEDGKPITCDLLRLIAKK